MNSQMFKLVLEKAEEPDIKLPTSAGSLNKQESSRKTSVSALLPLCGSPQTGKFFKRWEYQTTWPASWEIYVQVRKQQLELDMEQQIGSKLGKEYLKAVYCHPAYLTYMQSISWESLSWMKHNLESRFPGEIWVTSDMQMTPPLWQKAKLNIQKNKIMASGPITSWQNGETGNSVRLYFWGLQNHGRWWLQPWN